MPNYEEFVYSGMFDDYNEITLQFGFVTIFATNFPLVGLLAFVNNMIEIRTDAYKFVHVYRRPTPRPSEGIGTWLMVMEAMTFAAVTTNCANVFLVSDFAMEWDWITRISGLFVAEHIAYLLKLAIAMAIPDVSEETAREIDYEECIKEKALLQDLMLRVDTDFRDELHLYRKAEVSIAEIPCDLKFRPSPEVANRYRYNSSRS